MSVTCVRVVHTQPEPEGALKVCGDRESKERVSTPALKDGHVLVDAPPLVLGDALADPHDVANLLLLELDKGVVHA